MLEKSNGFTVGGKQIGALQGYLTISKKEHENVIENAQKVWKKVLAKSKANKKFKGLVRFDFIPQFKKEPQKNSYGYYLGELEIKGLYEINAHSPECLSCDALYRQSLPKALTSKTPSAVKAFAKKVKKEVGKEIFIVRGKGVAKDSWGSAFIKELEKEGLLVKEVSEKQAMKINPSPLYRWGDVDFKGDFAEFENDFQEWLFEKQIKSPSKVFNTLPESREKDVANKIFLAKKDEFPLLKEDHFQKALLLNKDDYVLKPLRGAGGNGIVFGDHVSYKEWEKTLKEALKKQNYGLFKKQLLPKINIHGMPLTMDFLPAFFADGEKLCHLYSVTRIEPWNSYEKRRTINVLQGGGYAGTITVTN